MSVCREVLDGEMFDSSFLRSSEPEEFEMSEVGGFFLGVRELLEKSLDRKRAKEIAESHLHIG